MKLIIVTLNSILLLSILTIFTSCNGQNTSQVNNGSINHQNSIPITIGTLGDTVKELGNNLMNIMQDKNNNYWFGSNGEGVYRYDPATSGIIHFTTKDGLCHNRIEQIQEDKSGNIYFNTGGGISKFDGQTFTTLSITSNSNKEWKLGPDDLWFKGAQDSGVVYRYDGKSLHRLEFPKTKPGEEFISKYPRSKYPHMTFNPYDVYSIYKDRKGNVWFGTNMGVCRYDGKTFAWISEEELGIDDIAFHVRSTIEDKNGKFWFSNTMHRFNVYPNDPTRNGKDSMSFKEEKGIVNSRDHNAAYFMSSTEDGSGDLWMVTYSNGVWRYNGETLTNYLVKDGDKIITLFSIYKDNQGDLWLGTHTAGAYKFNGKTFEKFRP